MTAVKLSTCQHVDNFTAKANDSLLTGVSLYAWLMKKSRE